MSTEVDEAKRRFLEDLAESGISQEIAMAQSKEAGLLDTTTAKGSNFKAQQFSLFALPTLIVYMQGIIPTLYPILDLKSALASSRVRRIRYASLKNGEFSPSQVAAIEGITSQIEAGRVRLFSDADFHKELVTEFAKAGGTVTSKATSKALALENLDKYNKEAIDFLRTHGITNGSGIEYLVQHTTKPKVDPSADFDW